MQNTGNESETWPLTFPDEPESNTKFPMTCIYDYNHGNIKLDNFGKHLKKCPAREEVRQEMLKLGDERKGGKKTSRVKGESYHKGTVLISLTNKDLPEMEQCRYDPRHAIVNSKMKYHCSKCCERISRGSNDDENNGNDPAHCSWNEMAEDCPAYHTPMENHHIHGCVDYETKQPKAPRKKLIRELGLDSKMLGLHR